MYLVIKINGDNITVYNQYGHSAEYLVKAPWKQFLPYLRKYDQVFLDADSTTIDNQAKLILEPNLLIAVTKSIDAIVCPRIAYVKNVGAEETPDRHTLRRITEGNLLHDVFSQKVIFGSTIEEATELVIDQSKLEIMTSDMEIEEARSYLKREAQLLQGLTLRGQSELECLNWNYGWIGRFDALTKNKIIELKTSKVPDTTPWPDHNLQMNVYTTMIDEIGDYSGNVIYIRDGQMGIKSPTTIADNRLLIARNYSYLVVSGRLIPPILRGEKSITCRNCFVKQGCKQLCAGLHQQRDCTVCPHNEVCDKNEWLTNTQEYFTKFQSALTDEEVENLREALHTVNTSHYSKASRKKLFERGEIMQINEKIAERVEKGQYISEFYQDSIHPRFRKGDRILVYPSLNPINSISIVHSAIIANITASTITLESLNQLSENLSLTQSLPPAQGRSGRRSIYRNAVSKSNLAKLLQYTIEENYELPPDSPRDKAVKISRPLSDYNDIQQRAISAAIESNDIWLIQGPAGTGKTTLIVELINQLLQEDKSILCSAFTNMAVDNIGLKLKEYGIPFIRLGKVHSTHPDLHSHIAENHPSQYSRVIDKKGGVIVLATTSTIGQQRFQDLVFDYALLDEAAQMTEPDALKPILLSHKAVLVGDHAQLQPIVVSNDAKQKGLHVSLFERLAKALPNRFILLRQQYRMNNHILHFPNHRFYEGKLFAGNETIAYHQFNNFKGEFLNSSPYQVIEIRTNSSNSTSQVNILEAHCVVKLVHEIISSQERIKVSDIGIITPLRAQVAYLRNLLPGLHVDTIDRYQGSEREIIIFSAIITKTIPIVTDPRRINVALTRAKKKLIVLLTDVDTDRKNNILTELFLDAEKRNVLQTLQETQLTKLGNELELKEDITAIHNHFNIDGKTFGGIFSRETEELVEIIGKPTSIFYGTFQLIQSNVEENQEESCVVCYQVVFEGIQCLGCSYWFHAGHLLTWIQDKNKCPVCRHTLTIVD